GAIRACRAGVTGTGGHTGPVLPRLYLDRRATVVGRASAELAAPVVTPAPEGAILACCTGVIGAQGHGGPVRPRPHLDWRLRVIRIRAELATPVVAPAP